MAVTTGEAEVAAVEVVEATAVEGAVTAVEDIVVGEGTEHRGVTEILVAMTGESLWIVICGTIDALHNIYMSPPCITSLHIVFTH